jgi:hypothetical protein
MSKLMLAAALATLGVVAPASAAEAALGPDAASCRAGSGEPALLVHVSGFKSRTGRVRVRSTMRPTSS